MQKVQLKDILYLQNGYAFKSNCFNLENIGMPLIRISNIRENLVRLNDLVWIRNENVPNKDFYVSKGDLLIAMSGATTGKMGVYKGGMDCLLNQRVGKFCIKENNEIHRDFVITVLLSGLIQDEIFASSAGGAQPNISSKTIEKISIPLPSLPEQKKIAKILLEIDKSISLSSLKLKKIEMLINAFRSSIEDVPDYKIYSLQEIISEKTIGTIRRGSGSNKNISLIKMGDISRGEIKYVDNESIEYCIDLDHLILRKGDILFNTRNTPELVGKTAIFSSSGSYIFDNNLMLLRFKEVVLPSFLNQLMNSSRVLQKLFSISSGTTSVAAIYWNDLKKIKLKLPPLEIQEKISANIESLEKIKLKINNEIDILKNLKMGISSDLFSGNKRVVL